MTPAELRAGASLAAIFALRMLGLFLILPVFAVYAGIASDRYGRKPVIVFGLLLFAFGSLVAALAPDIWWIIAGRVLQGAGAISAAVTALAADLTREQHRTKVMAMIGASIGLTFALSLVAAPLMYAEIGMGGIFTLTGGLALGAIVLLYKVAPAAPAMVARGVDVPFSSVLLDGQLARMNFGVLALHAMQTALWVVVPAALVRSGGLPLAEHWKVYLPAVLASFVLMLPAIIIAERYNKTRLIFSGAILLLLLVQAGLYAYGTGLYPPGHKYQIGVWLTLFFVGFNILEAMQPSLISRIAPAAAKGAALGIYNTTQSLGLFLGGILGGWLGKNYGEPAVHLFCAALALIWLALAATIKPVQPRSTATTADTLATQY
ncbi:MAG: MFS transporter [Betaproteobacteria bacterium]|nr:MFS transporter [Betaproteobacteria bacterium]